VRADLVDVRHERRQGRRPSCVIASEKDASVGYTLGRVVPLFADALT
jgi:hypothetical protein